MEICRNVDKGTTFVLIRFSEEVAVPRAGPGLGALISIGSASERCAYNGNGGPTQTSFFADCGFQPWSARWILEVSQGLEAASGVPVRTLAGEETFSLSFTPAALEPADDSTACVVLPLDGV